MNQITCLIVQVIKESCYSWFLQWKVEQLEFPSLWTNTYSKYWINGTLPPDISNFWPFVLTFDGFLFGPHTILKGLKIGWSFFRVGPWAKAQHKRENKRCFISCIWSIWRKWWALITNKIQRGLNGPWEQTKWRDGVWLLGPFCLVFVHESICLSSDIDLPFW